MRRATRGFATTPYCLQFIENGGPVLKSRPGLPVPTPNLGFLIPGGGLYVSLLPVCCRAHGWLVTSARDSCWCGVAVEAIGRQCYFLLRSGGVLARCHLYGGRRGVCHLVECTMYRSGGLGHCVGAPPVRMCEACLCFIDLRMWRMDVDRPPSTVYRLPSTNNRPPSSDIAGEFERVKRIAFASSCVQISATSLSSGSSVAVDAQARAGFLGLSPVMCEHARYDATHDYAVRNAKTGTRLIECRREPLARGWQSCTARPGRTDGRMHARLEAPSRTR